MSNISRTRRARLLRFFCSTRAFKPFKTSFRSDPYDACYCAFVRRGLSSPSKRAFDQTPTTPVDRDINDQSFSENVKYLANQKALQNELSIRPYNACDRDINDQSFSENFFEKCEISREPEGLGYCAFFVRRGLSSPSKRAFDQTPTTPIEQNFINKKCFY
ncbi:hypothetical protein PUN28_020707 [Cardiocondyla obscurior]|uniref:Uncharacterized protein n=1 Tax=Cardiocondyla obscurior TaxID=286306 RepID=A0AAW2E508_9HYME